MYDRPADSLGRSGPRPTGGRILPSTGFADMATQVAKRWTIKDLLAAGETSAWYGAPKCGKSALVQNLGLHVADGRLWQGRQVTRGLVLYLALERPAVICRRAAAFAVEHDLVGADLPFVMVRGPLDFREGHTVADVVATANDSAERHDCPVGLIIVDTFSRALCGGDENSPKDVGAVIANLDRIQSDIGEPHLALIHHVPVSDKERMRGFGGLFAALDVAIRVTKTSDSLREAEVINAADQPEGERIAFTLRSVIIGQDENGGVLTAPVVDPHDTPAEPPPKKQRLPKNAKIGLNALVEAVDEVGQSITSNHVPTNVRVVTVDHWRTYAYKRGIGGSEDKATVRKAFNRAIVDLLDAKQIGMWEPYAWPARTSP
jgi:AAA domain